MGRQIALVSLNANHRIKDFMRELKKASSAEILLHK
jgi:hypothetical protein